MPNPIPGTRSDRLRKRFYILFVARDDQGQLRKIPIPLHYAYVFVAGALIGMLSITGMAGSYTRMLMKVMRFNQVRLEREQLKDRYSKLEQVAKERDVQVASLGSLASEVSALYGLKAEPALAQPVAALSARDEQVKSSLDQFLALRTTAMSGAATIGMEMAGKSRRGLTTADWLRLAQAPNLWPVDGHITGAFGERIDPFNGEGAFHRGVDISTSYGEPIIAPADGVVTFASFESGYGRMIVIDHGYGFMTRYGHLSSFAVIEGQSVQRGQVIGYVGLSGRSTGPHLHYEVWVHDAPVNPRRFLRNILHAALSTNEGK
jgi:murein DD-endopeptidase MepM/ murein hydrolase activator NlpD